MKHIYILWQRLRADWRNMALLVAGIIIVLFLLSSLVGKSARNTMPLVQIGTRIIVEQDVIDGLMERQGNSFLSEMIMDTLVESYAAKEGKTVTPNDVEKVIAFERTLAELDGTSLEAALKQQGGTMNDYQRIIYRRLLQVKLLVPTEMIEQAVQQLAKSGTLPYTIPTRYQYRGLLFETTEDAKKAVKLLNTSGDTNLEEVLKTATNGKEMKKPSIFMPGLGNKERDATFLKAIKGLKEGQCGEPTLLKLGGGNNINQVMQLVKIIPEEKPTMANRGLYIGNMLLNQDEFRVKEREMRADALHKIAIYPLVGMAHYPETNKYLADLKLDNPQIPSPEDTVIPGLTEPTGASGTSTQMAPDAGAPKPDAGATKPKTGAPKSNAKGK